MPPPHTVFNFNYGFNCLPSNTPLCSYLTVLDKTPLESCSSQHHDFFLFHWTVSFRWAASPVRFYYLVIFLIIVQTYLYFYFALCWKKIPTQYFKSTNEFSPILYYLCVCLFKMEKKKSFLEIVYPNLTFPVHTLRAALPQWN